jgi:hypothetical protein
VQGRGSPETGEAGTEVRNKDRTVPVTFLIEGCEMSTSSPHQPVTSAQDSVPPRVAGLATFAGVVLVVAGIWHVLEGIGALMHDQIYVATPGYIYSFDLTVWGWILLVLGIFVATVGVAVLLGQAWGLALGMVVAGLGLLVNFLFIPWYPVWSVLIIGLFVAVIWALCQQLEHA